MDQLRNLKDRASETHVQWGSIRGQRSERERELQELRHQARDAERESEAYSLLPDADRPEPDVAYPTRIAEVDAELSRFERLEIEAEAMKNEAHEELQREVRKTFPGRVQAVQRANADVRKHLEALGEAALEPYLQYVRARTVLAEADADLAALQAELGGDRRAKNRQQNEVRSLLDAGLVDATDLEILGQFVLSMLN